MSLRTAIITTALALGASTCGGSCDDIVERDETASGPIGSYLFGPTCEALTVTVSNYEDGTRFFVYTDGAPPYHLDMDNPTHTFPLYVDDYGITVINPDGTQVDGPIFQNPSTCE